MDFFCSTIVDVECTRLIGPGSAGHDAALLILLRDVQAIHVTGGEGRSWLQKRTWHRISCCLMCDARCCGRPGLSMIGEQHKRDGN